MVNAHTFRRLKDAAVHPYYLSLCTFAALSAADSVEYPAFSLDVPFVFIYSLVIFGVDDCVFAPCEWDAAEGIAVADAPIQKCKPNERLYKPVRNVKINPDNSLALMKS